MGPSSFRLDKGDASPPAPRALLRLRGALASVALASAVCVLLVDSPAFAGENGPNAAEPGVDRARAAYDRGVRAHALGDHAGAARAFAEADALAPKAASLEAALESAMKADDAVLGAELVERADGRAPDAGLRTTLEAARRRFAGRTGKIRIDCAGEARCLAAVDGAAADARKPIFVGAGPHAVVVQRGSERFERLVDVKAEQIVVVAASADAGAGASAGASAGAGAGAGAGANPPGEEAHGISRGWFWLGLGVTAVLGGATVISGLDAVAKHDHFKSGGCANGASGEVPVDCGDLSSAGTRAQTRTNVLLGATAVLAVTTVAIGIFAVRWKDGTEARVTFAPSFLGGNGMTASAGLQLVTR
ncbi:MAG: hypothetical protein QOI41_1242 [Myxococcales bacterium]|nr:hypothetical protein [Myxococcales bacterium]